MTTEDYLPAVVLPNGENAQDSVAIVRGGNRLTMSELLLSIGPAASLRFMVNSRKPMQPQKPRFTWQRMANGEIIISAAFEYGQDNYGRATSAAVIFLQSKASDITKALIEAFPDGPGMAVSHAVLSKEIEIAEFIEDQRLLGKSGGEIGDTKKKSESYLRQSHWV